MNNITEAEVLSLFEETDDWALILHIRPDGDTVGSAAALRAAYPEKNIALVCCHPLPERLVFIAGDAPVYLPDALPFRPRLTVAIDVASAVQLGDGVTEATGPVHLKIDHHARGDDYAARSLTCPDAACGEIIGRLITLAGRMNPTAAAALYAAIASDTGCFCFSNTTPATLRTAAALMEQGIPYAEINTRLFHTRTASEVAALTHAYNSLHFYRDGTVAAVTFTKKDRLDGGIAASDVGAANDIPRDVEGVDLGIVLSQSDDDPTRFKISMRSNRHTDAAALCARFGGGGHLRAAGGSLVAATPEEAEAAVIRTVLDVLGPHRTGKDF